MRRYFGGLMFLVAVLATFQNMNDPSMAGGVGFIWMFVGIPGAIWLFRKPAKKD